ncbi:hypothetical protein GCM10025864_28800 [Luteimicrobium album]|uniref:Uncharacterized protein n=1 Tax=Luteimicrobium album TaxID=1054550 RepID=A0ABQ6I311_9MICO|nr:hypothetical protein GCM10025864_28800 [Luteimicrobium album]
MIRRIVAAGSAAVGLLLAGTMAPAVAADGTASPVPLSVHVSAADVVLKPHATRTLTVKGLMGHRVGAARR